jgi:hypothetical protein
MPPKELPEKMVIETLREILVNPKLSDAEIAGRCLGDPRHAPTVSGIRRNPPGLIKDRKTGELHLSPIEAANVAEEFKNLTGSAWDNQTDPLHLKAVYCHSR